MRPPLLSRTICVPACSALAHLPPAQVKAVLKSAAVNVLGTPSRKESLILALPDLGNTKVPAAKLAPALLGKRCFVQWPYLQVRGVERAPAAAAPERSSPGCDSGAPGRMGGAGALLHRAFGWRAPRRDCREGVEAQSLV